MAYSPFTPANVTPDAVAPVVFTPVGVTPDAVAPVAFTPVGVTPDAIAPVAFTPTGVTPSAAGPTVFFPVQQKFLTTADLIAQTTALITPSASETAIVGTSVSGTAWKIFTLTAGAHAADATHLQPVDYDATLNAKTWVQTATGNYP